MCAGTSFWLSILMRRWTWPWIIVACSSFASRWKAGWWARPKSSLNTIQKNTSPGILQPIRLNQRLHHSWLLCFSCKIGFTKLKYERSSKFKHSWELWWPSWKRSEVEISAANVAGAGRQLIWPRMKLLWLFKKVRIRLLKKRPSLALFRLCQVRKSLFVCPVWLTEGYRGYSVRKEYGCGPNKPKRFQCSTIQEEAANTIQYFWRKWKGKSLFQQLLFYRADKQQQLTYFCQQVRTFTFRRFDPL